MLCLLLLSPGIPEYLSGSSPISAVVLNPPQFVFQLAANLGLYGPGVLLVREAMVGWRKGWASVLLLGAAYGILEEGIALSTLFDPSAGPVGPLGTYGHWEGVNWIWSAGIIPVHMIFSVSLPILLLGLALPETKGARFLDSGRKVVAAPAILAADVAFLILLVWLVDRFWMGAPVFILSLLTISLLVCLARAVPSGTRLALSPFPRARPRRMLLIGVVFYPSVLVVESFGRALGAPALADLCAVVLLEGLFLLYVLRAIGSERNEPQLIALAFGLILPIAAIGLIATIALPLALVGDLAMAVFFRMLWRRYARRDDKGLSEI